MSAAAESIVTEAVKQNKTPTHKFVIPKDSAVWNLHAAGLAARNTYEKGPYGAAPPRVFTQQEIKDILNLSSMRGHEELTVYDAPSVPYGSARVVSVHRSDMDTTVTIGYFHRLYGCCGAAFLALISGHNQEFVGRYIELLCIYLRSAEQRAHISAIVASGQTVFENSLKSLGFVCPEGNAHKSKKTASILKMYVSPRNLNWKYVPDSVLIKAAEIRAKAATV